MSMRYLLTVAALVVAGLAATAGFNLVVDPFGIFQLVERPGFNAIKTELLQQDKAYVVRHTRPSVLILGSSRPEVGLDPRHPALPPGQGYNLSRLGANIYEVRRNFEFAVRVAPVRQAIIGVDFFMFNTHRANTLEFQEARLGEGSPEPFKLLDAEHLSNLLSLDATLSSLRTLAKQQPMDNDHLALTQGQGKWMNLAAYVTKRGGYRQTFLDNESHFMSSVWFPQPTGAFELGEDRFESFRAIVKLARAKNIDVRFFINPSHARQWEALRAIGLWPEFEAWKRRLIAELADDAREHPDKAPLPLWDFSGADRFTSEPVPPLGDAAKMRFYWDSSHYTLALGEFILDRIMGYHGSEAVADFGALIGGGTIDAHLARLRDAQTEYERTHPDDVAEIEALARQAQANRAKRGQGNHGRQPL